MLGTGSRHITGGTTGGQKPNPVLSCRIGLSKYMQQGLDLAVRCRDVMRNEMDERQADVPEIALNNTVLYRSGHTMNLARSESHQGKGTKSEGRSPSSV